MGFTQYKINTDKLAKNLGIESSTLESAMADCKMGGFVKIWKFQDKGTYGVAQVSASKKHKDGDYVVGTLSNGYDIQFQDNFVRVVGSAYEKLKRMDIPKSGLNIQIASCDNTNKWDGDKKMKYQNRVIYGFDVLDNASESSHNNTYKVPSKTGNGQKGYSNEPTDEDIELPF